MTFFLITGPNGERCFEVTKLDNGRPGGKKWNGKEHTFILFLGTMINEIFLIMFIITYFFEGGVQLNLPLIELG